MFLLGFILLVLVLGFIGPSLLIWLNAIALYVVVAGLIYNLPMLGILFFLCLILIVAVLFCIGGIRRQYVTKPIFKLFKAAQPRMSDTEREAIDAGTVWWDAELFSGDPDWDKLLAMKKPELTAEEQAFMDGPVEQLCEMTDDWAISHETEELTEEMWKFIKDQGFLGLIIPKEYGGKGFSALSHSSIVTKLSSASVSVAVSVMVPNSLGPAELLLHYGTDAQKKKFLPRLASGEEVPCFALTGPEAGSDAGAMTDVGVVGFGQFEGEKRLGVTINWKKRYITLGPIATLLGLAFKLHDPDGHLGDEPFPGITLALIPTDTEGIDIGNRHRPMNMAFQNGPNTGTDVFIPVEWIIGGPDMAGKGWRMLMESLAAGRAISLPALATGSAKLGSRATGAYAGIRRQFNVNVGQFEGVQAAMARLGGNTYLMDAARIITSGAIDDGAKPSVISAIMKYHLTERMRQIVNDAMDIHGGRGICMGPRNYLARGYQGVPIGITVEGANILTRSLIIFGQGAIRCHPFVLTEMLSAQNKNEERGLKEFDQVFYKHIGHVVKNACRTLILGITNGYMSGAPADGTIGYYYRSITRLSAALAFCSDISMLVLGGRLKRLERISGRLGDVLSYLYLASTVLKHFHDKGHPKQDRPLVHWACRDMLFGAQQALNEFFRNLPIPVIGRLLSIWTFPLGRPYIAPSDANDRRIAMMLMKPSNVLDDLVRGVYVGGPEKPVGRVVDALHKVSVADPASRKIRNAVRIGNIAKSSMEEQINQALAQGIITEEEKKRIEIAEEARMDAIMVDDFPPESFGRNANTRVNANVQSTQSTKNEETKNLP